MTQAPIFISHGAPTLVLEQSPTRAFLERLGREIERPQSVLAVSAHWETDRPMLNAVKVNETIHDFSGLPREMYELDYPALGDPLLAGRADALLRHAGFDAHVDERRGLDHGAWVPLMLMFPDADVPTVQLSVQPEAGPEHHLRLGRALAELREEGVLILASGSFTHDLSSWRSAGPEEPEWVRSFAEWMDRAIVEGRTEDLLDYRRMAPNAERNHPTEEHLLPLYVALGAAGPSTSLRATDGVKGERLHSSLSYGVLRMDAYRFSPLSERT